MGGTVKTAYGNSNVVEGGDRGGFASGKRKFNRINIKWITSQLRQTALVKLLLMVFLTQQQMVGQIRSSKQTICYLVQQYWKWWIIVNV